MADPRYGVAAIYQGEKEGFNDPSFAFTCGAYRVETVWDVIGDVAYLYAYIVQGDYSATIGVLDMERALFKKGPSGDWDEELPVSDEDIETLSRFCEKLGAWDG